MEKYLNNPQQEFCQKVTIKKTGINIPKKYMQDAYYSEISSSDTGLKILIAQSRKTATCLQDYQIVFIED